MCIYIEKCIIMYNNYHWKKFKTLQTKPVTVTFVFGNGEADKVVSGNYGDALTAPANPTRRGYEFTGWDKEIPATLPYEDTTITAKWKLTAPTSDGNTVGGSIGTGVSSNKYMVAQFHLLL